MVDYKLLLENYLKNIHKTYKAGDTTEPSYYPDLKKLFEQFLESKGISPNITVQPRLTVAGIPDFTVRKNKELIGYVEAKELSIELDKIENTEQLKRYKEKLPNFILTNYLDFWLWRRDSIDGGKGKWVKRARIGQPAVLRLGTPPPAQDIDKFVDLLDAFFSYYIPERKSAKSLAIELASRAQLLPPYIIEELNNESETEIDRVYNAFKQYLISDLTKEDFADIYAQTITYGLFTARLRYNGKDFNRFLAEKLVPRNIQILHDTFHLISHEKLMESIAWIVDDIATVLAHADIDKIRKELHREKGGDDPLMHFYETFLAEYDPAKRKARGVYYTPLPVVSYITRSINILLKEKFGKGYGFASEGVTLLDPASGTLTFPANAVAIAKEEIDSSPIAGSWLQVVKDRILKNYYAFELLMAPYIIGHLKMSLLLEDLGYKMSNGERFQLYLTNTLDLSDVEQSTLPYVAGLSEEAIKAKKVKENIPVLVVMGNPPYSVSSSNIIKEGSDFYELYESYKEIVRKEEKNIQPLSDDYIKFIAFAHWKIKQTNQGIIGMITNNSYLDGLIHRDMRRKLAEDFDEIYVLNLHGNSRLREETPTGDKDENVFDIQQGVGIILLVKSGSKRGELRYADLYGLREDKYRFLETHDVSNTDWQDLEPRDPYHFFLPKDFRLVGDYEKFISVNEIFGKTSSGIKTHRDHFVVGFNDEEIKSRLRTFTSDLDDILIKKGLELDDTRDWKLRSAREELKKSGIEDAEFYDYLWRPFDFRRVYYSKILIELPRFEVVGQMVKGDNLALCLSRKVDKPLWDDVLAADVLVDVHSSSGQTYVFPLFIYADGNGGLFSKSGIQQSNFNPQFWQIVKDAFIEEVDPRSIFNYVYAVLYSKIYRKKYNEFLKIDFPRIPFTRDIDLFCKVAGIGKELVELHLLKSEKLGNVSAAFPVVGDNGVKKREYKEEDGRLYINDTQYFSTIAPEVWNYYIGGYQVLDKWLKDRIGKILSTEDISHLLKVATAIDWTIHFQKEVDKLYPEIEKGLVN